MLVEQVGVAQPGFVAMESGGEEARLLEQLRGALVRVGGRLELAGQQAVEVADGAVQPAR